MYIVIEGLKYAGVAATITNGIRIDLVVCNCLRNYRYNYNCY